MPAIDRRMSGEITRADAHAVDALDMPTVDVTTRIDGRVLRGYLPDENPYDSWLEFQRKRMPTHEWLNFRWLSGMMHNEGDGRALAETPVRPLPRSHFRDKESAIEDAQALALFDVIAGLGQVVLEHDRTTEVAEVEAQRAALDVQTRGLILSGAPTIKFEPVRSRE